MCEHMRYVFREIEKTGRELNKGILKASVFYLKDNDDPLRSFKVRE